MSRIATSLENHKQTQWFIFTIACLIYLNTIPNKWTVDDSIIIHQNSFVKRGTAGLGDIFTKDAFAGFYGPEVNLVSGGRYRPLSQSIFAIQAELFAQTKKDINQEVVRDKDGYKLKNLDATTLFPNVLHFFNFLFYGLLCLVLYRTILLLLLTRENNKKFKVNFIAAISAILFAVHPLHTESVANIKGLDEILTLLGSLLSLYCLFKVYVVYKDNSEQKLKWIMASVGCYFLALLAKESAITFIAIIPLALWFFSKASFKTITKLSIPLVLTLLVFLGIRAAVIYNPNKGEVKEELMNDPFLVLDEDAKYVPLIEGSSIKKLVNANENTFTQMPFSNRMATNFYTYGRYLKLLIVPYPLTIDYYPRHIEVKSFGDVEVLFSLLFYLFLLVWAILNVRKKKIIAFGILFYLITFSIVSNFFFPIGTNMAERFLFMPSVGFCIIIATLLYSLGNKLNKVNTRSGFSNIYLGLGFVLVIFSGITVDRNFDWRDNFTLFSNDALVSINSGKIQRDLATEYIQKSLLLKEKKIKEIEHLSIQEKNKALELVEKEKRRLLEDAIPLLIKSLEIHPISSLTWLQIGTVYHNLGQLENNTPGISLNYLTTALAAYEQVEVYKSKSISKVINNYISNCYMDLGKLYGQKFGKIDEAIAYLENAKLLTPKNPEIYLLLGTAFSIKKDYEKTIEYTQKSYELRPNDRDTKENLAISFQQYAYADTTKKELLFRAEKLLLEVYNDEKKLADNDVTKHNAILRTLDLLYKNYTIQGNKEKMIEFKSELLKYNPNAFGK